VTGPARWSGWLGEPGFIYEHDGLASGDLPSVYGRVDELPEGQCEMVDDRTRCGRQPWQRARQGRINDCARMDVHHDLQLGRSSEFGLAKNGSVRLTRHLTYVRLTGFFNECERRCNRRVTSPARCSRAASRNRTLYEGEDLANGCVAGAFDVFSTAHRARAADSGAV
jgi:hypothetical protein